MANQITRAYIRHYSDNGQTTAYVEWKGGGRTEGPIFKDNLLPWPQGTHMQALFAAAVRQGLTIEREV